MLKIGDFARLGGVTIKTLHYYDNHDLLKPYHIDSFTSYRYYTIDQLPRLNRILALKDLGFSLDQIRTILKDHLSSHHLQGLLRHRQAQIQELVKTEQSRLARVEARLKQIEREHTHPPYDILLKEMEPQTTISIRTTMPTAEAPQQHLHLVEQIIAVCLREAIPFDGMWSNIVYNYPMSEQNKYLDIEMATTSPVDPGMLGRRFPCESGEVVIRKLALGQIASLIHVGDYDGLWQAYFALLDWANDNGYQQVGAYRQVMHRLTFKGGNEPVTEAQLALIGHA